VDASSAPMRQTELSDAAKRHRGFRTAQRARRSCLAAFAAPGEGLRDPATEVAVVARAKATIRGALHDSSARKVSV
jgi:hypothetical protein